MKAIKLLTLVFALLLAGCGQQDALPPDAVDAVTPPIDLTKAATVKGTVTVEGAVPRPRKLKISGNPECSGITHGDLFSEELIAPNGRLQNAIVYVKTGLEDYKFPVPQEPVLIDQKGCTFIPHVVAVQEYQKIDLLNSDPTMHNVNARSQNSRGFNIGFPSKGMKRTVSIKEVEVAVPIRCDLHPWMQGYIAVFGHPYFQVTGADGAFSFNPLPPGKYEIEVWHESLGTQTQTIEVTPAETKEISFTFSLN